MSTECTKRGIGFEIYIDAVCNSLQEGLDKRSKPRQNIYYQNNKKHMKGSHGMHMLTFTLLVIGGLNWLLQGLFGWEIGAIFGGQEAVLSRIIYVLVGLSAVYEVLIHKSACRYCGEEMR